MFGSMLVLSFPTLRFVIATKTQFHFTFWERGREIFQGDVLSNNSCNYGNPHTMKGNLYFQEVLI